MQMAQSLLRLAQKEKHFLASDDHFLTPLIVEMSSLTFGAPLGRALTGQASTHLVQMSQNFATPGRFG
jgi:hypothetical protein|tara:strand:- start:74 stop:277 length:204 start_codon:yes stop_codon:yes gene_type:complete